MLPGNHTHKTRPQNCGKCSGKGLTTSDWIERFRNKFGETFDYSKFEFVDTDTKIVVICPEHGEYTTTLYGHLGSPTGCERCSSGKTGEGQRVSTDLWLKRFRDRHGDKFDYSLFSPTNQYQKCTIICREHGPFEQTPKMHWNSEHGCPNCAIIGSGLNRRITHEEFISRSSSIHEGKYDYSNSDYTTGSEKVSILCPIHGEFLQSPPNHLQGQGCWDCGQLQSGLNQRTTDEEWILQFFEAHGDTYDYSKFASSGAGELATIICPEHGEFEQSPIVHSKGHGCWGCGQLQSSLNRRITTDEWINRFRKRHGDEYDTVYL